MDLNVQPPAYWTSDGPYEVADYCVQKETSILVLLNAWLDSGTADDEVVDRETMSYWAARLRPLWEEDEDEEVTGGGKETIVIVCNRCGEENGECPFRICLTLQPHP